MRTLVCFRLERAQQNLQSWASQHRNNMKRDLSGSMFQALESMFQPETLGIVRENLRNS